MAVNSTLIDLSVKLSKIKWLKALLVMPWRKYKEYCANKQVRQFHKYGLEALEIFNKCMVENGYKYSLAFGTLLGAIREHDFIPHDNDIDLAMWIEDYTPKLIEDLKKYGIKHKYAYTIEDGKIGKEDTFVSEAKLIRFYENVRRLAAIWLDGEAYTDIAKRMEAYVLRGGVYGTLQNKVLVQQQKTSGKLGYIIQRIFLPYNKLKQLYPVVVRHRWLFPFLQVRRWCRIIIKGRAKRSMQELTYSANISKSTADEMKKFLDELGL